MRVLVNGSEVARITRDTQDAAVTEAAIITAQYQGQHVRVHILTECCGWMNWPIK